MGLVLKTRQQIFGLKTFSRHEMFLVISRCRENLVNVNAAMRLADVPVRPRCVTNSNEYFTKFIPIKFFNFFPISFFIVLLTKSSK